MQVTAVSPTRTCDSLTFHLILENLHEIFSILVGIAKILSVISTRFTNLSDKHPMVKQTFSTYVYRI